MGSPSRPAGHGGKALENDLGAVPAQVRGHQSGAAGCGDRLGGLRVQQAPGLVAEALGLREHASTEHSESSVVLAGFPFASCASTSAQLHTADSLAGADLLKKWQQLDRTDSWWLPSLGGKKLRLALQPRSS